MSAVRRFLWGVWVLASLHLVFSLGAAVLVPEPPAPGPLMAAAGGSITDLGIQFHRTGAERFLPVFGALLRSLDPGTTVHVVVTDRADHNRFEEARFGWFPVGGGPRVEYAYAGRPITSWMRDRLAVLDPGPSGGPAVLLAPAAPMTGPEARAHDWTVPWTLGEHLGGRALVRATEYRFDGGDLIADEERVYVATPLVGRNPGLDPEALYARLERDLGRPVLRLGSAEHPVPDHHIGMFLTPLGDGRVAVGDPDLALAALEQAGVHDTTLLVGGTPLSLDLEAERLDRFRRVAQELRAAGLEVVPVPILPSSGPYVFMSYNNVLVERRADGRLHVYLPVYGVDALDAAATEAWEDAGAVVHPIAVDGLFRLGGSVRCLVAPLARVS
jgi:hypothetical protein